MPLLSQNLPITLQLLRCYFLLTSEDYTTSTEQCQIPFLTPQRNTPDLLLSGGRTEHSEIASSIVSASPFSRLLDLFAQRANEITHSLASLLYHELPGFVKHSSIVCSKHR